MYTQNDKHKVIVYINYKILLSFLKNKKFNSKQLKWYKKLIHYDFEIKYIKNVDNIVTNELDKKTNYESKEKKTRKIFQKNETIIELIEL